MRVALLAVTFACGLFAQVDRGNIQGTVTDPSGAVVTGAAVRIVSPATNLTQSTVTGPSGTYAFFNLPIGVYNVSVEGKGFRRSDVTGVRVEVNQQAKVDVSLAGRRSHADAWKSPPMRRWCRPNRQMSARSSITNVSWTCP